MLDEEVTKELEPLPSGVENGPVREDRKWLRRIAIAILLVIFAVSVTSVGYFLHIRSTPEYSLALILDAARSGDKVELERFVDTEAIVDDFVSQVLGQVAQLYGRGVPANLLKRLAESSGLIAPAIKGRVEAELPAVLRKELVEFSNLPFWVIVLGMDRYTIVTVTGDKAIVRSVDDTDKRTLTMVRSEGNWRLVAVKDDALAREFATSFGTEIMTIARDGNLSGIADLFGIKGLGDLLNRIDGFLSK